MWVFYLLALLPALVGGALFLRYKEINLVEWLVTAASGFVLAVIFQLLAIHGMTADIETWSGQITQARDFSRWQEYYEYAVYRTEYYTDTENYTDSDGRTQTRTVTKSREVFDHWEPTSRWHDEHFSMYSTLEQSFSISKEKYLFFTKVFNDNSTIKGERTTWEHNSRMIAGDPNDYVANNRTGYIHPVTDIRDWQNRVKAAPSLFSYRKVPKDAPVFNYPPNKDSENSNRLLGEAAKVISLLEFDRLNARLGPIKRVNVILIGFGNKDSSVAQLQESKWIGGKKNDVVICYGGETPDKATWSYVFGWTERDTCKHNIETIVLENKIDNNILPLIEAEIKQNYIIKDWTKFDYIAIEPPTWSYWVFFFVLLAVQVGAYYFNFTNYEDKR